MGSGKLRDTLCPNLWLSADRGKLGSKFDMSRQQVAFMLHNISVLDQKQYALQVEFGLAQTLTDVVMLLLHGNKFCMILKLPEET